MPTLPAATLTLVASDAHESLQHLVDELGEAIGRPVDLEDRDLHVLAYSAHEDEVDAVRLRSILARSSSPEVDAWMRRHGIHGAQGPVHLPAAPELGMAPRVCVPVRDGAGLLGFLWLVDEPGRPLAEDEIATASATAATAAALMRGMREAQDADRARRTLLLTDALAGDARAAAALIDDGGLLPAPLVTVAVTAAPADAGAGLGGRLRRLLPFRHALDVALETGELALAITLPAGTDPDALLARLAETAGDVVGMAEPRPSPDELAVCLREARAAALVARRVPGRGPGARFARLGTDGALALLDPAALAALRDVPGLVTLAAQDPDGALRATLLTWLDHGGDATAAAEELSLHRATLYHRLKRIEALSGTSLEDGETRLALHLALRAARLLPA